MLAILATRRGEGRVAGGPTWEGIMSTKIDTSSREETVEELLARGGRRIERIEDHPLPDGHVLLRGQCERQQQFAQRALNTAFN